MKDFMNLDEQILKLKSKGLTFNGNEEDVKNKLLSGNYYNIINGYKKPFLCSKKPEKFIPNTSFDEIFALYTFDREIRSVIFSAILSVESVLRSLISYYFSEKYGNQNYLQTNNFDLLVGAKNDSIQKRKSHILALIADINRSLSNSINKKDYITHYISSYGFVPLWVLVNDFTLGQLSKFYSLMKQPEKIKVSMYWDIKYGDLETYINTLSYFRNLSAHDDRIYDAKCNFSIKTNEYHKKLNIPKNDNDNYIYGKKDLFSLIIILKILMPNKDFNTFVNKINGRIESLSTKLNVIEIEKIKRMMGLPDNWYDIKK